MAAPTEPILLIATDNLGGDGFVSKVAPVSPVTNEGYGKQSLNYQQLNYMFNNQANWLKYITEELIPTQIVAAKLAMELRVGTIIEITGDSTNPATLYGYGTWESFGRGLVTVGVGEYTDDRSESKTWVDGDTEGEYKHVQTESELALHPHDFSGTTDSAGAHDHTVNGQNRFVGDANEDAEFDFDSGTISNDDGSWFSMPQAGAHTHPFSGTTDNRGSSAPMNNIQPSIAVYRWKRTA